MSFKCKECNEAFKSERSLHAHIKKHGVLLAEYYTTHYPRYNKLTGDPLPFKNKFDYFNNDFSTYQQMLKWCKKAPQAEVKSYIFKQLKNRIASKGLQYAPNHLELQLNKLPPLDLSRQVYGSYSALCEELEVLPLFDKSIMKQFFVEDEKLKDIHIFIDTREQKPLVFENSSKMKLDFGDYTAAGENYSYTYVDRKSETDFKSTLSTGLKRFKNEIKRARNFDSYVFIVIESSIKQIKKRNLFGPHKSNLGYIWHNMREITHEFKGTCQFVFTGSRSASEWLIPRLLLHGKDLWRVDLQYFLDNHDMGTRTAKK
jgi:hypothetical protein